MPQCRLSEPPPQHRSQGRRVSGRHCRAWHGVGGQCRPLLQCLNGAGARGDDRRDATSERFGDDQAKRLDSGREYEQIGGIPSLIESRAS